MWNLWGYAAMVGSLFVIVFSTVQGVPVCSEHCGLHPGTNLRPCHKETGKCLHGCVRGRHGDHCDQRCSHNCINTICNQGNGGCTIGCMDGFFGYFCNITTVSTAHGAPVCDLGKYGENCDLLCSEDCGLFPETNLRPCHKHTGKCLQGCVRGRHGDHCDQLCSQNCISTTCNQPNGECTMGCTDGYAGYFCNIPTVQSGITCDFGKYGENCDLPCSEDCGLFPETNLRPCHKHTGKCLQGCVRGRHGDHCDQLCSQNCIYTMCEQRTGGCTMGCIDGYAGYFCNTAGEGQLMPILLILTSLLIIFIFICCWKKRVYLIQRCGRVLDNGYMLIIRRDPLPLTQADRDLFYASRDGDIGFVKAILSESQVDVNCRVEGKTPVIEAARFGHTDVVECLVQNGAEVSLVDSKGYNAMHYACWGGNKRMLELIILQNTTNINSRGWRSRTPLIVATHHGRREVVELLVNKNADVSLVSDDGNNILHVACTVGHLEIVEFILSIEVIDINSKGWSGRTPVMMAAIEGRKEVVEHLVSEGADVSLVDEDGDSILHRACIGGHLETVQFVLSLGMVRINAKNMRGKTALEWARSSGRVEVAELLVSHATPSQVD